LHGTLFSEHFRESRHCVLYEKMVFGRRNSLVEEKRRLEARVAQLEEEIDEEHVELEQLTDKARKSAAQV